MFQDENVTISNTLYSFRSNFSPNEALTETLMTEVREVTWTRETWKGTYDTMVEQVGNATNEKIDTFLIPSGKNKFVKFEQCRIAETLLYYCFF